MHFLTAHKSTHCRQGRPSAARLSAAWSMAAFGRPPYTCPPEQFNKGGLWPPAKPVFLSGLRPPANDQHFGRMAIVFHLTTFVPDRTNLAHRDSFFGSLRTTFWIPSGPFGSNEPSMGPFLAVGDAKRQQECGRNPERETRNWKVVPGV